MATATAGSTFAGPARPAACRWTSTPRRRRKTATTWSSGWPRSRGAPGRVGMWGLSYGGFTSIQVAATRPPHLKAIVPIQATDDRYTDDVHYVGGAMTVSELSQYAVSQVAMNALPALPSAWGEGWGTAGASASRPRRCGSSSGPASNETARTGARARSRRTTARIEAAILHLDRLDRRVRRCGGPDAGAVRSTPRAGGRSSGRGSTASRTTPTRPRTSTGCARWSGGSIAGSRTSRTAPTPSRR